MPAKLTQEEFILRAKKVHGSKYIYGKTKYRGASHKIKIICKKHGYFFQWPMHHLKGHGCVRCMGERSGHYQLFTLETFIKRAKTIHKNQYNYDKVKYLGCENDVKIFCNKHKIYFNQKPEAHLNRRAGCPKCAREKTEHSRRLNVHELIKTAISIHKNRYNYSRVKYTNCDKKVEIICPNHGSFFQSMYIHVTKKCGCPNCYGRISAMESRWLEENNIPNTKENRQVNIKLINGSSINVDGYIPEKREIYEFFGDYWHGNILIYKKDRINVACNKTYLELYEKTMERIRLIQESGYNLTYIWEHDYKKRESSKKILSDATTPNTPFNIS